MAHLCMLAKRFLSTHKQTKLCIVCLEGETYSDGICLYHGIHTLDSATPALVELPVAPHITGLVRWPLCTHVHLLVGNI